MLPPMKIDFTAPVGPRKFLRAWREELAAMRFVRIGVEQMGATLGAEITEVDLRLLIPEGQLADRRAGQTGGRAKCENSHCSVYRLGTAGAAARRQPPQSAPSVG